MLWLAEQLLFCGDGAPHLKLQMEQASPSRGKGRGQGTVKMPQLELLEEPLGSMPGDQSQLLDREALILELVALLLLEDQVRLLASSAAAGFGEERAVTRVGQVEFLGSCGTQKPTSSTPQVASAFSDRRSGKGRGQGRKPGEPTLADREPEGLFARGTVDETPTRGGGGVLRALQSRRGGTRFCRRGLLPSGGHGLGPSRAAALGGCGARRGV